MEYLVRDYVVIYSTWFRFFHARVFGEIYQKRRDVHRSLVWCGALKLLLRHR